MVIYIEQIIATNVIVNYVFIKAINLVFKEKTNRFFLFLGLLISVLSLTLFFVPTKYLFNLRYIVGIIIGIVVFHKGSIKEKLLKIIIYYFLNITFVGTLVIFNVKNDLLLYGSLLLVVLMWMIENYKSFVIKDKQLTYDVIIGKIKVKGYLDSGNQTYCNGIPVVFIKSKYQNNDFIYEKQINVSGIGSNTMIDIYSGPLLLIKNQEYVVYYAFVNHLMADVILNWELGD